MVTYSSTASWSLVELPILGSVERTTEVRELSRPNWPTWTSGSTQVNRIGVWFELAESKLQSTAPSSAIVATLMTERIDPNDAPCIYNYNFYLVAETTDRKLYMSGPIRTTDPAHHSSAPSTWFEGLG